MRKRMPNTFLLFPVSETDDQTVRGKRGLALIVVITIVIFVVLFTADLILTSQVSLEMTVNHRDRLKAEYMAKSAVNLASLLLTVDMGVDAFTANQSGANASLSDGLGDIWSMLNGIPIGGGTVELMASMQEQFGLSSALDSGVLDQLKIFDGDFTLQITDESGKINLNYCAQNKCSEIIAMLEALFNCPAEKQFMEAEMRKENLESPTQLAYLIRDYIDFNNTTTAESGYSSEDDPYSDSNPKYRAKNAPLDTLDELKMIKGWNERIHTVFSPYFTIFPYQEQNVDTHKLNINTVPRELLYCFFPESRGECAEQSTLALFNRNQEKTNLAEGGQKIGDILKQTFCYQGESTNDNSAKRDEWFTSFSEVFRIEATGSVGNQDKVITAIIQRKIPDVQKKEKESFKILYWKST